MYTKESLVVCFSAHTIVLIVALVLFFTIRKENLHVRKVTLYVITILLVLLELWKQLYTLKSGYTTWAIPLHFCSFFTIWAFLSLCTKGKAKKFFEVVTFVWSLIISISLLIGPIPIYGGSIELLFNQGIITHSFLFHELVLLYFFVQVLLNTVEYNYKYLWYISVAVVIYGAIAIPCAYLLNTNYCAILTNVSANIEKFRLEYGQVVYNIFLFLVGSIGGTLVYYLSCLIYNKVTKKQYNNAHKKDNK